MLWLLLLYFGFGYQEYKNPYYMQNVPQHLIVEQVKETKLTPDTVVTFTFTEEQFEAIMKAQKNQDLESRPQADEKDNAKSEQPQLNRKVSVYFNFDSYQLTVREKNKLSIVANDIRAVELKGYASPEGSEEYNLRLSKRRIDTVKNLLSSKGITIKSEIPYGEQDCNVERERWPSCRRVEVIY